VQEATLPIRPPQAGKSAGHQPAQHRTKLLASPPAQRQPEVQVAAQCDASREPQPSEPSAQAARAGEGLPGVLLLPSFRSERSARRVLRESSPRTESSFHSPSRTRYACTGAASRALTKSARGLSREAALALTHRRLPLPGDQAAPGRSPGPALTGTGPTASEAAKTGSRRSP
jgi:hypothetical protein